MQWRRLDKENVLIWRKLDTFAECVVYPYQSPHTARIFFPVLSEHCTWSHFAETRRVLDPQGWNQTSNRPLSPVIIISYAVISERDMMCRRSPAECRFQTVTVLMTDESFFGSTCGAAGRSCAINWRATFYIETDFLESLAFCDNYHFSVANSRIRNNRLCLFVFCLGFPPPQTLPPSLTEMGTASLHHANSIVRVVIQNIEPNKSVFTRKWGLKHLKH